ncbi:MAG: sterol desaturase family protein [Pseudomonadota bacterium]|nr:sterol desaturase family protein [Pseudomonadota bacterium]
MDIGTITLPTLLVIISTTVFLVWEHVRPGRELPNSTGWYARALLINFTQLGITLLTGSIWMEVFSGESVLNLASLDMPAMEGFLGWFVGTFVFYWWHRLRHKNGWWVVFHQVHHSASRIEVLTSFYKHPFEILVNSFITAVILFPVLGVSLLASFWYNFFAATGEYFYHANVKTPRWLRYFVQTPELHSVHHQYDVHSYNYSDIPVWDRIFGTYRDMTSFTDRCGFPEGAEQRLPEMLVFRDVYEETT